MNILVIEDNSIAAAYLKHKLKQLKGIFPTVQVELALSLRASENILKTFTPNLITLDLTLESDEDSNYVTSQIPYLTQICPVVVITSADLDIFTNQKLLALRVDSVLKKDTKSSQAFMTMILSILTRVAPKEETV